MAQFDVHANPGRNRDAIPYVVVLQNVRYDRTRTRFVAALMRRSLVATEPHWLAPDFSIGGIDVVLDLFNLATIAADRFGAPLASLGDDASAARITRALDEFTTTA